MKRIETIIVWFCVALLPSFSCGVLVMESITDKQLESPTQLKEALNKMADNNETINDIFKPSVQGYLGSGIFGVTYNGTLSYPNSGEIKVAMKFTHFKRKQYAEKEYEIYSYLNAIENPKVEHHGIPSVYYYGTWRCTIMMAISLLDSEFNKKHETGNLNVLDALIVCKEFVRISKYIHSRGIFHRDIKLANMMFRRNNGFIIDYNRADKMYNTSTLDTSSRLAGITLAKKDWKMFIRTICICLKIQIKNILQDEKYVHIMEQFKTIKYKELGRVFFEMGKHIVGIELSSYDRVYNFINKEIEEYKGETPKLVHWLTNEERNVAKDEINTIPAMSSMADPFMLAKISYPDPDPDHFRKKMLKLKSGESSPETNRKKSSVETSEIGSRVKKRRS